MNAVTLSRAARLTCGNALVSTLLAACTVGPTYHAPRIATPSAYLEAGSTARTTVSSENADLSAWWKQFNDPILTALVDRALADSPTLSLATSRVRAARLQEIQTGAAEYPSISATGNALALNSNRKSSAATGGATGNASGGGGAGLPIPPRLNLYTAGFDATWEVDLFGGTRRSVEEAKADTGVSLWARRDAEVTLVAEVANDYLTLRSVQARIAVGQAELQHQRDLFGLIRARRQAGFVTNLDVNQQSTLVATAAAEIPQLGAQAKTEIHALGVLLGAAPEALDAELTSRGSGIPPPPPKLPLGLPSELLQRRPDIREAERRLAAANAEIGVQTAALYPKLNLMALPGFVGPSLGNLFSSQNLSSVVIGMASEPLFNAGRNRAAVAAAKEKHTQAELAYRIAVLGALRDVEDALARYRSEDSRRASFAQSVEAAENSLSIAQDQYRTGFVSFINVLQAQGALLNARDQLTQSEAQVVTDLVAIYKALGGGWST